MTFLAREYDVVGSCLKVDVATGEVVEKAGMLEGRFG
jgi:hypothetical protein